MDVTDQTFQDDVLARSATVPVDRRPVGPVVRALQDPGPDAREEPWRPPGVPSSWPRSTSTRTRASPRAFSVQSIPAVFAIADGQVVDQFIGALPEAQVTAFVQRLAPVAERGRPAGRGRATRPRCARRSSSSPTTPPPPRRWPASSIDRGDAADALALLQRLPETETSRALAAEARLLEAGVDVVGTGRAEMEAKLDELLDRVRDDDAARQEFVDLLEAMGADDPRTNEYRRALAARLF